MNLRLGQALRLLLAAVVFGGIVGFAVTQQAVLARILDSWSSGLFLSVGLLVLLQSVAQFTTLPVLLRPFGIKLSAFEAIRVGAWSALIGAVGPLQAGTAYKAAYLKFTKRLQAADIAGLLLALNVLRLLVCLAGGLLAFVALRDRSVLTFQYAPVADFALAPMLLLLAGVAGIVLFLARRKKTSSVRAQDFLAEFVRGLRRLLAHPTALLATIALHVLQLVFNAWIFSLLLEAAGYTPPLWLLVGYVCVKYLANLVVLLPFNLGVSELLTGLLAEALGAPLALGIAVAFQVRVLNLLLLGLIAFVSILRSRQVSREVIARDAATEQQGRHDSAR